MSGDVSSDEFCRLVMIMTSSMRDMVESLLADQMLAVLMSDALFGQTPVSVASEPSHCLVTLLPDVNIRPRPGLVTHQKRVDHTRSCFMHRNKRNTACTSSQALLSKYVIQIQSISDITYRCYSSTTSQPVHPYKLAETPLHAHLLARPTA
jgi:hypothetical protein